MRASPCNREAISYPYQRCYRMRNITEIFSLKIRIKIIICYKQKRNHPLDDFDKEEALQC